MSPLAGVVTMVLGILLFPAFALWLLSLAEDDRDHDDEEDDGEEND